MGNVMREYWIPFLQAEDLRRQAWVLVSHSLAVPSKPPPAASPHPDSALRPVPALGCPSRVAIGRPLSASQSRLVPIPNGGGDVDLFVQTAPFTGISAADVPVRQAGILAAAQQPLAASALNEL
jgi:hypothetical protein